MKRGHQQHRDDDGASASQPLPLRRSKRCRLAETQPRRCYSTHCHPCCRSSTACSPTPTPLGSCAPPAPPPWPCCAATRSAGRPHLRARLCPFPLTPPRLGPHLWSPHHSGVPADVLASLSRLSLKRSSLQLLPSLLSSPGTRHRCRRLRQCAASAVSLPLLTHQPAHRLLPRPGALRGGAALGCSHHCRLRLAAHRAMADAALAPTAETDSAGSGRRGARCSTTCSVACHPVCYRAACACCASTTASATL